MRAHPGPRVPGIPARTVTPGTVQLARHHRPGRGRGCLKTDGRPGCLNLRPCSASLQPSAGHFGPGGREPRLAAQAGSWLGQWWSPQQISRRLRVEFLGDPMMRVTSVNRLRLQTQGSPQRGDAGNLFTRDAGSVRALWVGGEMTRSVQGADVPAQAIAVEGGTRPGPPRGPVGSGHEA